MYIYDICTVYYVYMYTNIYIYIWDKYVGYGKADQKSVTLGKTSKRS